jgi:hypothetical protein
VLNFKFQTCRVPYILLRPAFSGNLDQLVTAAPQGSNPTSRAEEEFTDTELENLVALSQIQQVGDGVCSYRICFTPYLFPAFLWLRIAGGFSGSVYACISGVSFHSIHFLEKDRIGISKN